jgi:hypothetical protein
MSENVFDTGDEIVFQTTITDRNGNLIDPSGVAFEIKFPDGSLPACVVTRDSLGVYESKAVTTLKGRYFYRWTTTGGDYIGADERSFSVRSSAF